MNTTKIAPSGVLTSGLDYLFFLEPTITSYGNAGRAWGQAIEPNLRPIPSARIKPFLVTSHPVHLNVWTRISEARECWKKSQWCHGCSWATKAENVTVGSPLHHYFELPKSFSLILTISWSVLLPRCLIQERNFSKLRRPTLVYARLNGDGSNHEINQRWK